MAGYSRLIGADESGTLHAFKTIQAELFEPTIAANNGRLVKTTGDGFLVEFSSVVEGEPTFFTLDAQLPQQGRTDTRSPPRTRCGSC